MVGRQMRRGVWTSLTKRLQRSSQWKTCFLAAWDVQEPAFNVALELDALTGTNANARTLGRKLPGMRYCCLIHCH